MALRDVPARPLFCCYQGENSADKTSVFGFWNTVRLPGAPLQKKPVRNFGDGLCQVLSWFRQYAGKLATAFVANMREPNSLLRPRTLHFGVGHRNPTNGAEDHFWDLVSHNRIWLHQIRLDRPQRWLRQGQRGSIGLASRQPTRSEIQTELRTRCL